MVQSRYIKWVLIVSLFFLPFCGEDDTTPGAASGWLIPESEVVDGGPGKDGIIAISNPKFIPISQATFLLNNDLVVGIQIGDVTRAFPHPILDQHEIVNYTIDSTSFALSYCPLTGTAMAWDASSFLNDKTFGVSGLLYNSNLILYDRETDSNWSQMLYLCVSRSQIGQEAAPFHVIETSWQTWKQMFPQSQVMSNDTGFNRNYHVYPYGDYKTSDALLFSVANTDSRLHKKERVLGVIVDDKAKVYQIKTFNDPVDVVNDSFRGVDVVIAGSAARNFAVAFERKLSDGTLLSFEGVDDGLPVVMKDQEGTSWDVFGNGISGPRQGTGLKPIRSIVGYWFAWAAFYPDPEIHGLPSLTGQAALKDGFASFAEQDGRKSDLIQKRIRRTYLGKKLLTEWETMKQGIGNAGDSLDGADTGLRLDRVNPGSVLSELGLKQGDIIKNINGIPLGKTDNLPHLFRKLQKTSSVSVGIERAGYPLTMQYFMW